MTIKSRTPRPQNLLNSPYSSTMYFTNKIKYFRLPLHKIAKTARPRKNTPSPPKLTPHLKNKTNLSKTPNCKYLSPRARNHNLITSPTTVTITQKPSFKNLIPRRPIPPNAVPCTPVGSISKNPYQLNTKQQNEAIKSKLSDRRLLLINIAHTPKHNINNNVVYSPNISLLHEKALTPVAQNYLTNWHVRFNPVLKKKVAEKTRNLPSAPKSALTEGIKGIRGSVIHKGIKERVQCKVKVSPKLLFLIANGSIKNINKIQTNGSIVKNNENHKKDKIFSTIVHKNNDLDESDRQTVIENDCENDYSLICNSLSQLYY